jgi:hypothetical protein
VISLDRAIFAAGEDVNAYRIEKSKSSAQILKLFYTGRNTPADFGKTEIADAARNVSFRPTKVTIL